MNILLEQDEVAPDSLEYFEQQLKKRFNLTIKDFKEKGRKLKYGYKYKGLRLLQYPDSPLWFITGEVVNGLTVLEKGTLNCPVDKDTKLHFELIGTMRVIRESYYNCFCPTCEESFLVEPNKTHTQ